MHFILKPFSLLIFISCSCLLSAQMVSENHQVSLSTNYKLNTNYDSIYLYNQAQASVKVFTPDTTNTWNWQWQHLGADSFITDSVNTYVTDSVKTLLVDKDGCYQVTLSKDSIEVKYRAWCFFYNGLQAGIVEKDENDSLTANVECEFMKFTVATNPDTLLYRKLILQGDTLLLPSDTVVKSLPDLMQFRYTYTSVQDDPDYNFLEEQSDEFIIYNPPPFYATFNVNVSFLGFSATDFVYVREKATKARLKAQLIKVDDPANYEWFYRDTLGVSSEFMYTYFNRQANLYTDSEGLAAKEGVAPLWVEFSFDESLNANRFFIDFGDTLSPFRDTTTVQLNHKIYKRYTLPGYTANARLTTYNQYGCEDTDAPIKIKVKDPVFEFPNVFCLNNGNYRIQDESFRYLNITIFDRWGRKMHEYSGDVYDWQGWDGTHNGKKAKEGVYFFTYEAWNWYPNDYQVKYYYKNATSISGGNNDGGTGGGNISSGFFHLFYSCPLQRQ